VAYVLDEVGDFGRRCNHEMVKLSPLDGDDADEVRSLVRRHAELTGSELAWNILHHWSDKRSRFVKVFPNDYRRVIEKQQRFKEAGLSEEEAAMAAFEENAHDLARAGGK
jgi:glutamate synthase (ferredoxin)